MRVVHLVPKTFGAGGGIYGGAERYAYELARHMAQRTPTRLVAFGPVEREFRDGDLCVRVARGVAVRGQANNRLAWALVREIARADVVHCHQTYLAASNLAALLCRPTGRRIFATDLGGGGWNLAAYMTIDHWFHGHLHISAYSRSLSPLQRRAHVIYGGVDVAKFAPASDGPEQPGPVVYVGRLMAHKGVDHLVEAVPADMDLELIGRPYDARYVADLQALAAGKRVRFVTTCEDDGLVRAYQRALCVVLPSVYRDRYGRESRVPELLGQTLLEGMACGIPAICTNVASMPEVVEDGVTGFVVAPNDSAALRARLLWLRAHPDEARAMGQAARRRVLELFTWSRVVERCLDIYAAA
ncbi:MAG: glycosyltransferase family 4 protein [Gemmataceae bacterium]|nr:glycosyltransferase family 4 protein [Gemmataceae bacterium]